VAWPQPTKYVTDIAKAKALLAEAGYPNGFETTLSFDLGFAGVNEPLCVLVQESLAQIGIKTTINKIPGANWRTELNKKVLPLYTNVFSGWLDYPEYFFIWCYDGKNSIFNTMSYQSKAMDDFIHGAVDAAAVGDKPVYEQDVKGFVDLAFRCISPMSTSRCRRTFRAINTGSTAGSTIARWSRRKLMGARDTRRALSFPPPLWGRGREGGGHKHRLLGLPLSPTLPHKGGGSRRGAPC
jgi:hypothetical protein